MRIATAWAAAGCVCLACSFSRGADPARSPAASIAQASRPTTTSAPATSGRTARRFDYQPATAEQIEANGKLAEEWAEKVRANIAPTLRRVETDHYVVYSSWPKDGDLFITTLAEKVYVRLCQQFGISPKEMVWAGKCPIYTFMKEEEYTRFCAEIDNSGSSAAGGYCGYRKNGFCYIVMKRARNVSNFNTILAHEATHGFLFRCVGGRKLPRWVNEGMSEYVATILVPDGFAARRFVSAGREAVRNQRDIMPVFKDVTLDDFDYGIAQSLVRVLIGKDKDAFIDFLDLLQRGKSEEEALAGAFGWTREDLVKAWATTVRTNY